jgi:hypothetical protein
MDVVVQQAENAFFRFVWRFNALAIAAATTLCLLLGLIFALEIFRDKTRPQRVTNVVNVDTQDKVSEEFSLGTPGVIAGTSHVRIPLYRGQTYGSGSSLPLSKTSQRNVVNYLFLNASTNESKWLFSGVGQLVIEDRTLFNKVNEPLDRLRLDPSRTGVGVIYSIVERDSNGDNRLTEKDAISLATSNVDGTNYRKLTEGIDQLYSIQQVSDDKVLVLYQKDQQTFSDVYSLPSMERLTQANIPKVGTK